MQNKDIFLCHASEDKESVVRPLASVLESHEITCWLDEAEILWGESITRKVNQGLATSRFVLVVLSAHSMDKNWPQRELDAAQNLEASSGQVKILPLLVGNSEQRARILGRLPLLNDKRYLVWDGHGDQIVQELILLLGKQDQIEGDVFTRPSLHADIPMPRIKKAFTDLDRERFLRESFAAIASYFQAALKYLDQGVPEIDTDFDEIQRYKFVARIFINGQEEARCKVWRGGLGGDGIGYCEDFWDYDEDNTFSEQLSIESSDTELGLKFLMGCRWGNEGNARGLLSPQIAAEELWKRFIQRIEG
jgi:hypothetical protein